MKILAFTIDRKGKPSAYQFFRYIEELNKIGGLDVDELNYHDLYHDSSNNKLYSYEFGELPMYDAVISRINNIWFNQILQLTLQQFPEIKCINKLSYSKDPVMFDKFFQYKVFLKNNIPIPDTLITSNTEMVRRVVETKPMLIKPYQGSYGDGIRLLEKEDGLEDFKDLKYQFLVQEVLPNKTDYRVLVLNGKSYGVMRKKAGGNNFVSNFSKGGSIEYLRDEKIEDLAIRATEVIGLDYAGVDIMLNSKGEPLVLEVNRNAQFLGFESCSKLNIASEIINFILNQGK